MSRETIPKAELASGLVPLSAIDGSAADMRETVVPALGSVIAGKYRVDELIARGGMGVVYLATHLISGKRIALKWMLTAVEETAGARERFVREAQACARIDHPNVVDIYDVGSDLGSLYLVMELLLGETLAEYLQRNVRLGSLEAVTLLMPAMRGVAYAHAHHVIHRDLKPENIFLCRSAEGEPRDTKVLDFGISKITATETGEPLSLTRSGAVVGTPYYMPPEQVRGSREVDERADVYAFGVILYELVTGQRPFDAETYNQLILKIATESPAPISTLNAEVDPRLVEVIERAMAREPEHRYPNVVALALALEPFSGGVRFRSSTVRLSDTIPGSSLFELPAPRRKLVRKRFVAAGVALGCLLGGLALWALAPSRRAPPDASDKSVRPAQIVAVPVSETTLRSAVVGPSVTAAPPPAAPAAHAPAANPGAVVGAIDVLPPSAPASDARAAAARERAAPPQRRAQAETHHQPAAGSRREPRLREPAAPGAGEPRRLPSDWDDRLSIPSQPATGANLAGPLDARDFR